MHPSRDVILGNLAAIREEIGLAAGRSGRDPDDVMLVAAAKTVPAEAVRWVAEAGVRSIGHNYVQELREARHTLADLPLRWHFIGTLQSSTAHVVADLADVVETVAGERAARRLSGRAERSGRVLDVLIEVDLTGQRSGVSVAELPAFADLVAALPGVRLSGLMTLPPIPERAEDARPWFHQLRGSRDLLQTRHPQVLDLSMGMSLDYAIAVEEGATMVRIGTALFGSRTP